MKPSKDPQEKLIAKFDDFFERYREYVSRCDNGHQFTESESESDIIKEVLALIEEERVKAVHEALSKITLENYADEYNTYDYDAIAFEVIELVGKLQTTLTEGKK